MQTPVGWIYSIELVFACVLKNTMSTKFDEKYLC